MKKILISLILGVLNFSLLAQTNNLEEFWDNVKNNSSEYIKYSKNSSELKNKSLNRFLPLKKSAANFYDNIQSQDTALSNYLSNLLFGKATFKNVLFFDDQYQPNAGVDPNGNLLIGVTLCSLLNEQEFIAVMAHEATHLALKHSEIGHFNMLKKERNAKIWGSIAATLYTASVTYGQYERSKVTGVYNTDHLYSTIPTAIAISDAFANNIDLQLRLYSREQEIEADAVSAKLLDYIGVGKQQLISALTKIRDYYVSLGYNTRIQNKDSSHPTLDARISFLRENKNVPFDKGSFYQDELY